MEELYNRILDLSINEDDIKVLKNYLLETQRDVILSNINAVDDLIFSLSTEDNTLAIIFLLFLKSQNQENNIDVGTFYQQVTSLCASVLKSKSKILLGGLEEFIVIMKVFTELMINSKMEKNGIISLKQAIRVLQVNSEYLTPLHSDFLKLCLLSKHYKYATSILDEDIFVVSPKTNKVQPIDLLLYCYYGGMIHIGLKKYSNALDLFQIAITVPVVQLSSIMVESYKKYILLSLIKDGEIKKNIPYLGSVFQRNLENHSPQYKEISIHYCTLDVANFRQFIDGNIQVFQKDQNYGIVKQVLDSLYKRKIQIFTQSYLTLSLESIASSVDLTVEKTESIILKMIEDGDIYATINQADGMVRFEENQESYANSQMINKLNEQIQKSMFLSNKLKSIEKDVKLNSEFYIQNKISKNRQLNMPKFSNDELDDIEESLLKT
eukprot:TRINITY_DN1301_c4_g1_i1.p1 TRINITY_DN1301_c4_g1~~TRINITY_DN1301_c4_g1_i1.p1  ORF type:complete len:437 (+),score=93.56 TRINITY_DN1301_c4_g1_i1:319-1629(+)